jgi:hypothetical protein
MSSLTARRRASAQQEICDEFNRLYPVGTLCRYWTGERDGEGKTAHTRSVAEVLSGHTAVVWLKGVTGCVSLTHVQVIAVVPEQGGAA